MIASCTWAYIIMTKHQKVIALAPCSDNMVASLENPLIVNDPMYHLLYQQKVRGDTNQGKSVTLHAAAR